jgi:hypothetical protein
VGVQSNPICSNQFSPHSGECGSDMFCTVVLERATLTVGGYRTPQRFDRYIIASDDDSKEATRRTWGYAENRDKAPKVQTMKTARQRLGTVWPQRAHIELNNLRGTGLSTWIFQAWCPEPDSNRHGLFRVLGILSPVCLPIPPSGHGSVRFEQIPSTKSTGGKSKGLSAGRGLRRR